MPPGLTLRLSPIFTHFEKKLQNSQKKRDNPPSPAVLYIGIRYKGLFRQTFSPPSSLERLFLNQNRQSQIQKKIKFKIPIFNAKKAGGTEPIC
jgi:hypothetical protein